jgi:hypothetical protein
MSTSPITTTASPITRLAVLCRLRFFPEHGQKNRERGFQNCQRQQWHKELNSIAASDAGSVRRSHITANHSKRKIKKGRSQKFGYASPREIQQVLTKIAND